MDNRLYRLENFPRILHHSNFQNNFYIMWTYLKLPKGVKGDTRLSDCVVIHFDGINFLLVRFIFRLLEYIKQIHNVGEIVKILNKLYLCTQS